MLEIKNLSISIANRYIIKNLSLTLNKGDKLAVIGEEGNGKSTLLKSILGICEYANVTGQVNLKGNRIGYLQQTISESNTNKRVFDMLFKDDYDYYSKVNNLYKWLDLINLDDTILNQDINTLSGGEKVKVGILNLLLGEYNILFLDEPTNDLDIETLEWLEKFINTTDKPIIYVSHDETLLSNTANMILHMEQIKNKTECRHSIAKINYDTYIQNRLKTIDKQAQVSKAEKREFKKKQEKLRQVMQKVEYQQSTISRADPHGAKVLKKKMHSLKVQEKKLDNSNLTEFPDIEESIKFSFNVDKIPKAKTIIKLNISELKVKTKILSKNIKLDISGNSHLCIIGKNGIGKSTLIKEIYNQLKDRKDMIVGYMPQNYEEILDYYEYVLDFLSPGKNKEEITRARTCLGNMKFTEEEMLGKINTLSNGAKAKLFLAKLSLENCNVLILDEPTRNLSPLSNPFIRNVLSEYNGTIISVSHDRKFIDEVVDKLYTLTSNGLIQVI